MMDKCINLVFLKPFERFFLWLCCFDSDIMNGVGFAAAN